MKKIYQVMAVMETYCYLDIEATSMEEAYKIAKDTDGGNLLQMIVGVQAIGVYR